MQGEGTPPPPPPPPPEPAEVASTEVAASEAANAPEATEIPATPQGAKTANDTPKKKKSARRGDPTLGQNRELRKREVKSYRGDGVNSDVEEEEDEKPAKKRGRPSKGGITSSASKAFMKVTAKNAVPKAFEIPISPEQLELAKQEIMNFPDDAVRHGLTDLIEDDFKSEAAPAAATSGAAADPATTASAAVGTAVAVAITAPVSKPNASARRRQR